MVALAPGAAPEVVRHGVTGLLCQDPGGLPDALRRVGDIDPAACRSHVLMARIATWAATPTVTPPRSAGSAD